MHSVMANRLAISALRTRRSVAAAHRFRHQSWHAILLSALAALTTGVTAQQHTPSKEELRSMYCVEVIRAEIDLQQHMISASVDAAGRATTPELRQQWIDTSAELIQGLAKLEAVLYRFQAHMLPRIQGLDSSALAEAIREGNTDSAAGRARECENPTWLSF